MSMNDFSVGAYVSAKLFIEALKTIDGPVTRAVLQDGGVIDAMPEGALMIDMASVDPATDRALACR